MTNRKNDVFELQLMTVSVTVRYVLLACLAWRQALCPKRYIVGSIQEAKGKRQQAVGNRQQAASNRHYAIGNGLVFWGSPCAGPSLQHGPCIPPSAAIPTNFHVGQDDASGVSHWSVSKFRSFRVEISAHPMTTALFRSTIPSFVFVGSVYI